MTYVLLAESTAGEIGSWMLAGAAVVGVVVGVLTVAYLVKTLFFTVTPNGEHVTRAELRVTEHAVTDLKVDLKELHGYAHENTHRILNRLNVLTMQLRLMEQGIVPKRIAPETDEET